MRGLRPGAQLREANPPPFGIRLHPGGKRDAEGHVAASLNGKESKAVQISAHQSPRAGIKRCFGLAATGDKATISFKVRLMRQKEAASFDSFTALIRLHKN